MLDPPLVVDGGLALQPEVDQAKVKEAVQAAYRTFGQSFAELLFFDEPFFNWDVKRAQKRFNGALDGIRTRVTDCLRLAAREASILDRTILPELTLSQKTNNIKPFAGAYAPCG